MMFQIEIVGVLCRHTVALTGLHLLCRKCVRGYTSKEHRRFAGRTEFKGRKRMGLKTSSNGKILYIYVAGNTIDLYDAATYQYLRTITIDGDQTTELFVLPASPAAITSSSAGQ